MPGFKVNIPNPCAENWNAMALQHNGRFCKSCEKTVIDFTRKTPAQIQQTLLESTGKICGRFKAQDVQQPIPVLVPIKPRTGWIKSKWMAFAALLTLVSVSKKAVAQGAVAYTPPPEDAQQNALKKTATVVHGRVKASDTQKGLSQVEIRVYSGGKEIAYSTSFSNGSFFIDIPADVIWDFKIDIEFNALNYITQVLYDYPVTKARIKCDVTMPDTIGYEGPMIMGAYIVEPPVEPPPHEIVGEIAVVDDRYTQYFEIPPLPGPDTTDRLAPLQDEETLIGNVAPNAFGIHAFPNPTNGIFTVEIENSAESLVQVVDLKGRLVATVHTVQSREQLNLTGEPNGLYIVRVTGKGTGRVATARLVKVN